MIPSLVVSEIRSALVEFLATTFSLSDDGVRDELTRFLNDRDDGIFRGPYLRVRTPFRAVDDRWQSPLEWLPDSFTPYLHQAAAFDRLSSADGREPQPTLVTTGTGSGKTECFLYPLLDHCARQRALGKPGIKALILYPMNALASDQAERIAGLIHNEARLAGLRAGLYVGESGRHSTMGEDHLIDKREVLRSDPPDILLTNYKMLDFLLLRREDRNLWAANDADTLQYVVLDEFHTYDGAQGTDVAMLLRRLGRTLDMNQPDRPLGSAAPVATSATLGTGADALDELRSFAGKVFGTEFARDSVIGETRQTVEEACSDIDYLLSIPDIDELADVGDDVDAIAAAFCRQEHIEGDAEPDTVDVTDVVHLGDRLLKHPLTRAVLASVGEQARSWPDALTEINTRAPTWGRAAMTRPADVEQALGRFIWLLSLARREQAERLRPLFLVEVQLWVREVSRLLRAVSATPSFRWVDSAAPGGEPNAVDNHDDFAAPVPELPAIYCRRCGQSGWRALRSSVAQPLVTRVTTIYEESVRRSPNVRDLVSVSAEDPDAQWYDPFSRTVGDQPTEGAVPVLVTADDDDAKAQRCPSCGERDSIRFLGLQVASLASVAINTLFGSQHLDNNERKLLAFTDSVQDASHRAAFFAGRTHRFDLRTRMAEIISHRGSVTLDDLGDELHGNADSPHARFAVVPPDLQYDQYVRSVWSDSPDPYGIELLRQRLGFEADIEFGLRARVGRTLELSRVAVGTVDIDNFDEVVGLVAENLRQLDGNIGPGPLARTEEYVRGLLERLRLNGGIVNPLLQQYLEEAGRQWFIWGGRPLGLPPFTPGQGRPTFMTSSTKGDFDSLSTMSTTPSWVIDWARRVLGVEPGVARDLNLNTMSLLTSQTDGVIQIDGPGGRVWGLNRRSVRVWDVPDDDELTVAAVRCTLCGSRQPVPPHMVNDWYGAHCLRYRCIGTYVEDEPKVDNYYRRMYRSGATRRVVTGEHTGILGRQAREDLEAAFKSGTAPDAPNVITATPTLEMGIDIGELSAVMLTSVPRNPASYVQRVGRAGRLNGNSLITTFVRTDTHGLYYLSNPEAMISGDVRPPNCYLDAVETLQRQYIAYLFDRMADLTIDAEPLPTQIGQVIRAGLDDGAPLQRIVEASRLDSNRIGDFLNLFGDHLTSETHDRLREFASAGIEPMIKNAIDRWRSEDRDLDLRRRRLTDAIDALYAVETRTKDQDEELSSFTGQRAALLALLRGQRNEYTLSAMERIGLLPNYLLLGDTATLNATLWSRDDNGDISTESFEYTRSAQLALSEFAPGNTFYAAGHKHVIDSLEIGTSDEPLYETWRFCRGCGYGEIEPEGEPPAICPRCGDDGIADTSTRHTMLRLRSSMASSSEENARVYDERDERDREQYEVITVIDADPAHISNAWSLGETAFGAELAGQTKLRTINLGFRGRAGEQLFIGGDEQHVTRFNVCRHCGAVRDVRDDKDGTRPERLHLGWCKVRSGSKKEQWDALMLIHELVTEAVRVLLPVSMFEVPERLASFTGALLLGLREDFGGDPQHLEVARMHMPNRAGQGRRQFVVVYDRVPGGTGYLARLADPDRMKAVLEAGRKVISQCPCRSEGRRACHRCLLGVVDRHEYDLVARDLALNMLDELLDNWNPEPCDSITSLDIGQVEESELERRFKVAVRAWADHPDNDAATFRAIPGKAGRDAFELLFTNGDDTIRYRIDEQEGLGTTPNTTPDFVIHRQDEPAPDVAIYLDGYQFHASATINNLADDAAKREGIRAANKFVWNLTWSDVDDFHTSTTREDLRTPPTRPLLPIAAQGIAESLHHQGGGTLDYKTVNENPLTLLLRYLAQPDITEWTRLALSAVGGVAREATLQPAGREGLEALLRQAIGGQAPRVLQADEPKAIVGQWATANGLPITVFLSADDPAAERWTVVSSIPSTTLDVESEPHRRRWADWMQWANLLQFVRGYGRNAVITATTQATDIDIDHLWLLDGSEASAAALSPVSAASPTSATANVATAPAGGDLTDAQQDELDLIDDDEIR
ncbi:DEAD/DEAH box helicase, partial [Ilumatobacter sp.]|uniref:DEAD/DEAH box helicase n=1 Tax=Ilumatobacter sp. TaxID=1967498 RepID=UPI003752F762